MRYAIFSDVHSNLEALQAVLKAYEKESIDRYVSLGDTVGYGANPDACCSIVRKRVTWGIVGNHDAAVSGRMNYSYYYDLARKTLDLHASLLSEENKEWLASLPYRRDMETEGLAFTHGSPVDPEEFEYVFTVEQACGLLPYYDELSSITFMGHSHLTKCFALSRYGVVEISDSSFVCDPDRRYIITVGSVGQPRDVDARACCGIYDTKTRRFEYRRVDYPVDVAAQKIFEKNMVVTFGKRLFLGV